MKMLSWLRDALRDRSMKQPRVLATAQVLPVAEEILARFGRIEIARQTDKETLISMMDGAVALIVRGLVPITAHLIDSASDLRVIGRTGSGYENVDIAAATRRGIPVVFAPGAGAKAVAEATLAMMLAIAKNCRNWTGRPARATGTRGTPRRSATWTEPYSGLSGLDESAVKWLGLRRRSGCG